MKQLKRRLFIRELRKLNMEQIKLLRDTARALVQFKRHGPPVVYVDGKGRVWQILDVDFDH